MLIDCRNVGQSAVFEPDFAGLRFVVCFRIDILNAFQALEALIDPGPSTGQTVRAVCRNAQFDGTDSGVGEGSEKRGAKQTGNRFHKVSAV